MQNVLEFMAVNHDKLGNGFAAFVYVIKKTNHTVTERIRKELDKRAFQSFSRKLFSIYRYKIVNLKSAATVEEADLNESYSPERVGKATGK